MKPQVIEFRVTGTPKGQPRARAFARKMGNKFVARVYDDGTAEGWKGDIALAVRGKIPPSPIDRPCRAQIVFLFARPKRLIGKKHPTCRIPHTSKPDRDNLEKAVLDCLTKLGVWRDDTLVYRGEVFKFYVAMDELPGAEVLIEEDAV